MRTIIILTGVILATLLAYAGAFDHAAILDIIFAGVLLGVIYLIDNQLHMSSTSLTLVCAATLLNPAGIMGMYSHFFFDVIGYDKIEHMYSCFAITYSIIDLQPKKTTWVFLTALLITAGLGSINEINEFVGSHYLGISNGGMFTINDTLPQIRTDLQAYDTHFDMIFNLLGGICAIFFTMAQKKLQRMRLVNLIRATKEFATGFEPRKRISRITTSSHRRAQGVK